MNGFVLIYEEELRKAENEVRKACLCAIHVAVKRLPWEHFPLTLTKVSGLGRFWKPFFG